ncbi:MAG: T9SS type A sorting domain-containing protein [Flavobacteriales bacterium]|nr:T9SS type A sorting domain-containing protein [Flavobacteriales bacterium]
MAYRSISAVQILITILLLLTLEIQAQQWQSQLINIDSSGHLIYFPDNDGFKIPDYSVVGYNGNGFLDIPQNIAVLKSIHPIVGDNTQHIQDALDSIGNLPIQPNGFRGALYLNPGQYHIHGTIYMDKSGVVLYGSGNDTDLVSNTTIYGVGTSQRTLIEMGAGDKYEWWESKVSGTTSNIIDSLVPVGSKSFRVQNSSLYQIGDNIIIYYPFTNNLLAAMDYGGTQGASNWSLSYFNDKAIRYNTRITNISGDTIFTISPVYYTINQSLSQAYIYKYDRSNLVTNVGIEDIRIDMNYSGPYDENHPEECIAFIEAENAWARNCVALHFVRSGFVTKSSNYITIDSCKALDPISQITGSRRYNFEIDRGSQNILMSNCHARHARHSYISDGQSTTAGWVIYNCTSTERHDVAEAHRHWTTGILWDNYLDYGPQNHQHALGLHNRGDWGSVAHGWSSVHAVAWNCDVRGDSPDGKIIIQKPPSAQNYVIGCKGEVINDKPFYAPRGYEEGTDTNLTLNPPSLYLAQLCERLGLSNCNPLTVNTDPFDEKPELTQNKESHFSITVYPNPTSSTLIISSLEKSIKIELFNGFGQLILATKEKKLDLNDLSPGIYHIVAQNQRGFKVAKKFILTR